MSGRDPEAELVAALVPGPPRLGPGVWAPHRAVLLAVGAGLVLWAALALRWDWLPTYAGALAGGLATTLAMLLATAAIGFALAVPIGLVQVTGPAVLAVPARAFCTAVRGTPLLLQIWLLYYGVGSLFPSIPGIRATWVWPYLRESWPYAVAALSLSFAGYEGEVMRGAFAGVPRGELAAADAFGMRPWTKLRRIWLPRAFARALPTLTGEVVLQLKSTPLVATITVLDLYAVVARIRQDTYLTYEPLLFLAAVYMLLTGAVVWLAGRLERRIPGRGG
jgi:polar amino acid transport system permease protein